MTQPRLPQAQLNNQEQFYADCNEIWLSFVDRVNGKPVQAYHYSQHRPKANWRSAEHTAWEKENPDEAEEEDRGWERDDDDEDED